MSAFEPLVKNIVAINSYLISNLPRISNNFNYVLCQCAPIHFVSLLTLLRNLIEWILLNLSSGSKRKFLIV